MRLLLDTHTFLWFITGNRKLSKHARFLIDDLNNQVLVSIASLWEIAIKSSIGKLKLLRPFDELIPEQLALNNIDILPIEFDHLTALTTLPLHHRDPFDRIIIAQAMTDGLFIISKDQAFDNYGVQLIW